MLTSSMLAAPVVPWVTDTPGLAPMADRRYDQYGCLLGRVRAQFPSLSVEREFFQSLNAPSGPAGVSAQRPQPGLDTGRAAPAGSPTKPFDIHSDNELAQLNARDRFNGLIYQQLSQPGMRYIAREMCWTLIGQDGGPLANLLPTSNRQLGTLINALTPDPDSPEGAAAPCMVYGRWVRSPANGLCQQADRSLAIDRLLPTRASRLLQGLIQGLSPDATAAMQLIFEQLQSLGANCGHSDEERALNYLLQTQADPYLLSFRQLWNTKSDGPNPAGYQLVGVRTLLPRCTGRTLVRVILDFSGINTGAPESWYYSVDTGGEFPFVTGDGGASKAKRYLNANV
jgi:hypothetical protein